MSRFDISSLKIKNLKSAIKREFDFKSGSGAVQFNLSKIFSIRDCIEIYNKFNSNLNWIIRDSQKLILPNSQVLYAKKIKSLVDIVCKLIQKNLPEKNLIKLKIETLRVARSDGFQHQVGARWHQDHEAYFSLLINLNSDDDPMSSTRFYHLKPNEKYNLDYLGNPIISNNWKEDYIKPFHLGIFNSGVRYFLFPKDKCRPIAHIAPIKTNKRLAIFATFTISGIDQGMDLKDIYIPLSIPKNNKQLFFLRKEWRKSLGINNAIKNINSNFKFRSDLENSLYNLKSINFEIKNKKKIINYRIVDFGLRQFSNDKKVKNNKLEKKSVLVGEFSRTMLFFSQIKSYIFEKLKKHKIYREVQNFDFYKNNNYNLYILFKTPQKPFQLLKFKDLIKQIDSFAIIKYPTYKNFFFKKLNNKSIKSKKQNKIPKNLYLITNLKKKNLKSQYFLNQITKKLSKKQKKTLLFINTSLNYKNDKKFDCKIIKKDIVPFYLPRYGVDRLLPDINISSKAINQSKKILKK